MNAHACTTLTEGCYRCELNRDEVEAAQKEIATEAHTAWLIYRTETGILDKTLSRTHMSFIAGYLAANR